MSDPHEYLMSKQAPNGAVLSAGLGQAIGKQASISDRLQELQKLASMTLDTLEGMSVRVIGPMPNLAAENSKSEPSHESMDRTLIHLASTLAALHSTVNRLNNRL